MLRRLLASNFLDAAGVQLFDAALMMTVVSYLGFNALDVSLLNTASSISFIFLAVPMGIVVDRLGAPQVLVRSAGAKFVTALGALLCLHWATHSLPLLVLVVLLMGIGTTASETGQASAVPQLVSDPGRVVGAISHMTAADRIASIACPGLAGLLIAASSYDAPLALAGMCFALSLLVVLRIARDHPAPTNLAEGERPAEGGWANIKHRFAIIGRNRFLFGTTLLTAAGNAGLAVADVVDAVLVLKFLHLGVAYYGMLSTLAAVCGLAAAVWGRRIIDRISPRHLFGWGSVLQAVVAAIPLLCYFCPSIAFVGMALFSCLWAIIVTLTNVAASAYLLNSVDRASIGRAGAARRTIAMGVVPLATLGGGVLSSVGGLVAPLVAWPSITLVAAGAYFLLTSRGTPSMP